MARRLRGVGLLFARRKARIIAVAAVLVIYLTECGHATASCSRVLVDSIIQKIVFLTVRNASSNQFEIIFSQIIQNKSLLVLMKPLFKT